MAERLLAEGRGDEMLPLAEGQPISFAMETAANVVHWERIGGSFAADGHTPWIAEIHTPVLATMGTMEFNPNLRWIDVVNEIAFLMMDLDRVGRQDLARRFLNTWLAESGDFEGLKLLRFYQAYRAMVRTKIAAIRLGQELSDEERAEVTEAYREYLSLAETYTADPDPRMIITFGPSGCGKSVAAGKLAARVPAVQIRSDVERKRLAGLSALARSDSGVDAGLYTSEMSERTYARLLAVSRAVIEAGFTAIADATFLKAAQRAPFRALADACAVGFGILAPEAPPEELRRRVETRLARGDDPAEADVRVLEKQLAILEPLTADEAALRIEMEA